MGKCWKCEAEITLKEEEISCDNCNEIVNYCCHNCHQWFSVYNEKTKKKRKECKICGFFYCPECNTCGTNCDKESWRCEIRKIMGDCFEVDKIEKLVKFIEMIKVDIPRRFCPNGVPISYAKGRCKTCYCRTQGYRTKTEADKLAFKRRIQQLEDIPINTEMTVDEFRETGSYGQEWRDIINLGICYGMIKVTYKKNDSGNMYSVFKKIEGLPCEFFDTKDLIVTDFCTICKKRSCGKVYNNNTKNHKKGEPHELSIKISNKDTCKVSRSNFGYSYSDNDENSNEYTEENNKKENGDKENRWFC